VWRSPKGHGPRVKPTGEVKMEQKMSSLLQPKIDVAPSPISETDRRAMGSKPIEFQVLRPTEARQGGRAIPLSGARRRALVTRLLVDAGRAISADTLLEDVWDDQAPPAPLATL
jgi:hypothetical protein